MYNLLPKNIIASHVDEIVYHAIRHVRDNGTKLEARAGSGLQSYNINFILENSRNRIHTLRAPTSINYLAKELILFTSGTLTAKEMSKSSKFWNKIADNFGLIHSNYGYYVFYQKTESGHTQFEWVINLLTERPGSRRAIINVNQPYHKSILNKDFPCTIAMQFLIDDNKLHCIVTSRSTDVITGLPYNLGFFSFVNELVFEILKLKGLSLDLGFTMMKSTFIQLYDSREGLIQEILNKGIKSINYNETMPKMDDASSVLEDIYNQTNKSKVFKWLYEKSNWNY